MADEAGSSSAVATTSRKRSSSDFDVFLNFFGPDSHDIVYALYDAFLCAGVHVFYHDESIRHGEVIEEELMKAITNSSIYIPIFSKNYASSRRCLRELEKIMECWEASKKQEENKSILPIFNYVDSKDNKLKPEVYTTPLQEHKEKSGEDEVKRWEIALQNVADIKGWDAAKHGLTELIAEEVCSKLWTRSDRKKMRNDYVGIAEPMEHISMLLDLNAEDVRFVAIHGIAGIGKTTLARLVFNKISSHFEGAAFLSDICEKSCTAGIVNLQKDLLSQLPGENSFDFSDADQGVEKIIEKLQERKVFIVLDDIDSKDQLSKLAGDRSWFHKGSRIVITTRIDGIMPQGEGFYEHKMQQLEPADALKLLSRRVFGSDLPPAEYDEISEALETTGTLPLAINVIAPLFRYELARKVITPLSKNFDVFLNFQPPDSRSTVVDVLYDVLRRAGVRVFYDKSIWKEEKIEELKEAIINSKIYIPIFSKNYTSSKWCLLELELILKCWDASQKQGEKKTILPIFYEVDVSKDLKLKSGFYTTTLQKHENGPGEDVVERWENALKEAATHKGLDIRDHGLHGLAKLVVKEVEFVFSDDKISSEVMDPTEPLPRTINEGPKKAVQKDKVESSSRDFEVFLNFEGLDSYYTVANVLYHTLENAGIRVFYDDKRIRHGEVNEEVMKAINNSIIYIPIFSKNYASSKPSLRELELILECWEASVKQGEKKTIFPIFNDVDVSTREFYTTALQKHEDELGEDAVKPWEIALEKATRFQGFDIHDHGLYGLVKLVVEEVHGELRTTSDPEKFSECDSRSEVYDKISRDVMDTSEQLPQTASAEAKTSERPPWGEYESPGVDYEVFLNFQGLDSRHTITDVLYSALHQAGIRVFRDEEEIWKGEDIVGGRERAIINSKIYIPIFTKNYASSKWCLRELELIMKCWEASQEQKEKKRILPIFYDVDARDVRLRSKVYSTALQKHKERLGEEVVKPWEIALLKVTQLTGCNARDHGLSGVVKLVVEEVCKELRTRSDLENWPNYYVGIGDPMKDVMKLLDLNASDVRFVTIHGIGGIGKTTLARFLFRTISSYFPQGVAFLSDVRERSHNAGIANLQEDLISQLLQVNSLGLTDAVQGVKWIRERLTNKKILIILDDLDGRDQLLKLAGETSWFGIGSRIIITTRNIGIMPNCEGCYRYKMREMKTDVALKLFSKLVFKSDSPLEEFDVISRAAVDTTGRLPLAIDVIASLFSCKSTDAWEGLLKKLTKVVHKDVREKLMISYEQLDYREREIFLDIACLFINKEIEDATYYWEAQQHYPEIGIMKLIDLSLIEIVDGNHLQMCDLLRNLGRNLVEEENNIPERRSRLWSPEEALPIVLLEKGTKKVLALKLGKPDADCCFTYKQFAGLTNLMFLELNGGNFLKEDFKRVFSNLRWLSWDKCPDKFEATNLCFQNLIILMLSENLITDDWGGWDELKAAKDLKVLKCTNCQCLKSSPKFSAFPQLERLVFKNCTMLRRIHPSIGMLEHLTYLEFASLFELEILPDSIGGLKSLSVLKLKQVNLLMLPASIGDLQKLEYLCLWCPKLKELPESVGNLKLLSHLDISYTTITKLPESVSNLERLKVFKCDYCPLKVVPDNIKRLIPSPQFDPSSMEGSEISKDK